MQTGYLSFIRANLPFLGAGALLALLSAFGQTFFISIFGGEIRAEFGLSNGDWGLIYMIGTAGSAAVMVFAGGLADVFRVRTLGVAVVAALGLACLFMAFNTSAALVVVVIFFLRFLGQGMSMHVATVAMSRWFVATRGRALAVAGMGFMLAEMFMPLLLVWLKSFVNWHSLWVVFALICFAMCFVLFRLLRLERTPKASLEEDESLGMGGRHWTRGQALRHPIFWLMVPAIISFSGFGTAFWFHQVHFADIKGWSHLSLVAVFPIGTVAVMASTVMFGWAIDRFGAVRLLPFYLIPYVIAFVLHGLAPSLWWTALAMVFMGLSGGGTATLLNACWAEFYGTNHLGSIKAAATAVMVLGSAIGPGISGWLIDAGVGFDHQLVAYAMTFAISAVFLWIAGRIWRASAAAT